MVLCCQNDQIQIQQNVWGSPTLKVLYLQCRILPEFYLVVYLSISKTHFGRQASSESTETPFGRFYLVKLSKRSETTFADVFVSPTQKTLQNQCRSSYLVSQISISFEFYSQKQTHHLAANQPAARVRIGQSSFRHISRIYNFLRVCPSYYKPTV